MKDKLSNIKKWNEFIVESNHKSVDIFPKADMISLIKSINFKSVDSSELEDFDYIYSGNPFDFNNVKNISFDHGLLIEIDKFNDKYSIRVGEDTGWTGGLETYYTQYAFDIPKLDFEDFKIGLLYAIENQTYSLVSKWNSGPVDKIFSQGSISEITAYAMSLNYEVKKTTGLFDTYFTNSELPSYANERNLFIRVLTSQQCANINKKN